ncbi:MAG: condensation domain-containing protein [Pseudomonadota bacterium]
MPSQTDDLRRQLSALTVEQLHCLGEAVRREARDEPPRPQLTAYYTTTGRAAVSPAALKRRAAAALPPYMTPTVFVEVDALPALPNGKLDTRRLPTPLLLRERETPAAPEDATFVQFAALLADLLGVDLIHPDDNFFELGGDSITAIKLVSRCREAGLNVGIKAVTGAGTVAEIVASTRAETPKGVTHVHKATGLSPLTPIQDWFFAQSHPAPQHWNLAGVVDLPDGMDPDRLARAVDAAVTELPVLGTAFRSSDAGWRALVPSTPPPTVFSQHDSADAEAVVNALQQTFNLEAGWLIRFGLLADGSSLVWVAHHLVIDHVSMEPLMSAIRRHYAGSGAPLVQTSVSYRDWALRLAQLRKDRTAGGSAAPAVANGAATTQQRPREIDCDTARVMLDDLGADTGSDNGITVNDLVLLCLGNALRQTFDVDTLVVDVETHGRDQLGSDVDTAASVGWFTSFYPHVFDMPAHEPLAAQLQRLADAKPSANAALKHHLLDRVGHHNGDANAHQPSILFNFTGARAAETSDWQHRFQHWQSLRDPQNVRAHDLEFNASQSAEGLEIVCRFPPARVSTATVQALLDSVKQAVSGSATELTGTTTPLDYPDVDLSQDELDDFLDSLDD